MRPRPSAPPVRGWCVELCVAGSWIAKSDADQPPVFMDAFDDVSVQLELGDDGGREVNPAGAELGKSDRLFTGAQSTCELRIR